MTEAARNRWCTMIGAGHGRRRARLGRSGFRFVSFCDGPGGFPRGPRARHGNVRAAALILLAEEPHDVSVLLAEAKSDE
jgi:hypothetical protein